MQSQAIHAPNPDDMRITIFGAGGFIGSHMVEHLLAQGRYQVRGLDLTAEKLDGIGGPRFTFHQADIRQEPTLVEELIATSDVVVDLIAYANPSIYVTEPLEVFDLNFMQNLAIAKLCVAHRKRLIQYSSAEVYGKASEGEAYHEDRTDGVFGPVHKQRWIYATAKMLLERVLYAHGSSGQLDFTIVRPFNFIGSRIDYLVPANAIGGPRVFPHFISALLTGGPLRLVDGGHVRRAFMHIADANAAFQTILDHPDETRNQIYNVGNPDEQPDDPGGQPAHAGALRGAHRHAGDLARRGDLRRGFLRRGLRGFQPTAARRVEAARARMGPPARRPVHLPGCHGLLSRRRAQSEAPPGRGSRHGPREERAAGLSGLAGAQGVGGALTQARVPIRQTRERPATSVFEAGSRLPLIYLLLAFPMFLAAFGSLPRKIVVGNMTAMGALTIVEVGAGAAGLLACGRYPKWLLLRTAPYLLLLLWAALSIIWAPPSKDGFQNAIVYSLFGVMALFSGTLTARDPGRVDRLIDRGIGWISPVALTFVAAELATKGVPADLEESWWIGPRPVAILGVVVLSRYLARWYYGDKRARIWIVLWLAAIVMTISRAATATALLLIGTLVLAQMRFQRRRAALTLPLALGAVALVVTLALVWSPFYQRMFTGDPAIQVGGTPINVAGRARMWDLVVSSGREHPWIGQGLGTSQSVVSTGLADTRGQMSQPHNDYLRIWHDLGFVGLAFHLGAIGLWIWLLGRDWYAAERRLRQPALLELTGLLIMIGLSVVEITDNAIIYQAVMGTAGTLVGAGLGRSNATAGIRLPPLWRTLIGCRGLGALWSPARRGLAACLAAMRRRSGWWDAHMDEILHGASTAFVLKGLAALLTLGVYVLLGRLLGPAESGLYFLALTLLTVAAILGRIGLDNTVLRFVAASAATGDWAAVKGVRRKASSVAILASAVATVALVVGGPVAVRHLFRQA